MVKSQSRKSFAGLYWSSATVETSFNHFSFEKPTANLGMSAWG
jgi:hypothetical protein